MELCPGGGKLVFEQSSQDLAHGVVSRCGVVEHVNTLLQVAPELSANSIQQTQTRMQGHCVAQQRQMSCHTLRGE